MTSASELYHSRRSRLYSRYIDDMEFGFECPCERDSYFSHHRRRHSHSRHGHRHDSDFCDLCLRCTHLRDYRSSHYVSLVIEPFFWSVFPHFRLPRSLLIYPGLRWGWNGKHFVWVTSFLWKLVIFCASISLQDEEVWKLEFWVWFFGTLMSSSVNMGLGFHCSCSLRM